MLPPVLSGSSLSRSFLFLLCLFVSAVADAQPPTYATLEAAATNPDFAVQGEYAGQNRAIQVVAVGEGEFTILIFEGGLPGSGWRGEAARKIDGDADTVQSLVESMNLEKVTRQSPTLGALPPPGAVHLFDGTQQSLDAHWQPGARISDDGLLMEGATTKDLFKDYVLHLEFRTPFMPASTGQQRGNSGLYHQGRYENQILDSFGLDGTKNETGSIYDIKAPDINTCYPPLSWQTYDVVFTAATFDEAGNKLSDAKLTTRLNGVVVQNEVSVPRATRAAPLNEGNSPGPIYLQDHGNPVRFRNIWLLPRDAEREAKRPIVPGFERFFATASEPSQANSQVSDKLISGKMNGEVLPSSLAVGGEVLISSLGCVNCHAEKAMVWQPHVGPKLTAVASRVRADFLFQWIKDPHSLKPGTTMPDVLAHLSDEERMTAANAIASYLTLSSDNSGYSDRAGDARAAKRGETLYHTIGCAACHAPRQGDDLVVEASSATSVPLGDLGKKYTLSSLTQFLQDPHAVRPSGRMPKLAGTPGESRDLATFLLKNTVVVPGAQQFLRTLYRGSWEKLPDFSELTPVGQPQTVDGLSFDGISPLDQFGAVYEAFLPIQQPGIYTLVLGSDDGSRVLINGREVVRVDGVHPYQQGAGQIELDRGVHRLRVEYFEQGGEEQLTLEIEGGEFGRAEIAGLVTQDPGGSMNLELVPKEYAADPMLVELGRDLFASTGCANCHEMIEKGRLVESTLKAREFAEIRNPRTKNYLQGCLAAQPTTGLPNYDLSPQQQQALRVALATVIPRDADGRASDVLNVHATLAAANCYACHQRDSVGGPEVTRDPFFQTTTMEMGNEGRLPPPLSGAADKLNDPFIVKYLDQGANERPYMLTRMPGFGYEGLKSLHDSMVRIDRVTDVEIPEADQTVARKKADGRTLVGNDGLACVKCHTFNGEGTPGIQAIDMLKMTDRLRQDWFHRYLRDPQKYRPGTRMPASFPDGISVLKSIAEGQPGYQIEAMWEYLKDAKNAPVPAGLRPGAIELVPTARPIIYRNFLTDLTPRGIAVGYPEGAHIAWDANSMTLRKIWQNQFLDAALHWQGRGPGNLAPLGDLVQILDNVAAIAILDNPKASWPRKTDSTNGYRFRGYTLDQQGRPTFNYSIESCDVAEYYLPQSNDDGSKTITREFAISGHANNDSVSDAGHVIARLAVGDIRPEADGWFTVNHAYQVYVNGVDVILVEVDGQTELRAALTKDRPFKFSASLRW